jgi:hypothetical protein
MNELNFLISKIRSLNYKSVKSIYDEIDVPENVKITPETISNLLTKTNTFSQRVLLLTAIVDDLNEVTPEIKKTIMINRETLNFILRVTLLDSNELVVTEENEDGTYSYTLEGSKKEQSIKNLYEKAIEEFKLLTT